LFSPEGGDCKDKEKKVKFPSEDILVDLFEVMYFASIKTEEAEPIVFNIGKC